GGVFVWWIANCRIVRTHPHHEEPIMSANRTSLRVNGTAGMNGASPATPGRAAGDVVDYHTAYPGSERVYVTTPRGLRVPMRQINLSGGEPPIRVYDTAGPLEVDVRRGLPPLRREWILARGDVEEVPGAMTGV